MISPTLNVFWDYLSIFMCWKQLLLWLAWLSAVLVLPLVCVCRTIRGCALIETLYQADHWICNELQYTWASVLRLLGTNTVFSSVFTENVSAFMHNTEDEWPGFRALEWWYLCALITTIFSSHEHRKGQQALVMACAEVCKQNHSW